MPRIVIAVDMKAKWKPFGWFMYGSLENW